MRHHRLAQPAAEQPAAEEPAAPQQPPPPPPEGVESNPDPFAGRMTISGVLTAMVTPFDADGALNEEAAAGLMHHLLENGSDGLVLAGSTGRA